MEMEFSKVEKVVGTFIIGVSMLLMATLVIIGRGKDWFEKYIPYYTTFNESYNLQENAAVKLFKADIGKVKSITLVKNRVLVKLLILDKYSSRIREDAVAVVESPTLIGSEYISIIPGSADAPLIPPAGEIPSREKRSISDILSEFEVEKTARMVVQAVQDVSAVAHKLSDEKGPLISSLNNIQKISGHINQITADLEAGKGPVGAMLKSEALLQNIVRNTQRLSQILESLNSATAKAPGAMDLVKENLAIYRDAGESVKNRVDQAKIILDDIQTAAGSLQVIVDNIKAGSYNFPKISNNFRDGVQEIRDGVQQINRVVDSLQKNVFIRSNLPPEAAPQNTDARTRP